ncbi:O-methyltransferase [Nocardiopsis gilva YIM 90087]|uniref:O-methyltransferase n=1 Tax=Nocardiopsis gilva YIM 90087 TaxID=1235441 RepID=A0A223S536_9ACTN|nr:O-methyltransferase [Nocardiopsis gilva]ASU83234.1 O-methyltransferase [Nocardiopsis gilva YIM 90087]
MTRATESLTPELYEYLVAHSAPVDDVLGELAEETARLFPDSLVMQIGPEQGTFMTLLARLMGAHDAVEVGTFTGYSSICLARGLPADGTVLACDISEEWTSVARRYWQRAGIASKVTLKLAPALDTLRSLPAGPMFDLAFIDADKEGYVGYWDELVPRIRPGGALLVDNTFSHGRVVDPSITDASVQGIRDFNDHALADSRVELVMLPIGDGLTLARKKA